VRGGFAFVHALGSQQASDVSTSNRNVSDVAGLLQIYRSPGEQRLVGVSRASNIRPPKSPARSKAAQHLIAHCERRTLNR
jgi:hypothetical protein